MGHPGNSLSRSQHDGETQSVFYKFKFDFSSSPHCRIEPEFRCLIPPCQEMIVIAAYFSPPVLVVCLRVFLNHRCVCVWWHSGWHTLSIGFASCSTNKQTNKQITRYLGGGLGGQSDHLARVGVTHLQEGNSGPCDITRGYFFLLLCTV